MSLTLSNATAYEGNKAATKVTIKAKDKQAVTFTFNSNDICSIKCKDKMLKMGENNGTIDVGNLYDKIVNFLVKLRDANLSDKDKKANKHDTVIDSKDWQNIAKTGLENEDMVVFTQGFEVEF